MATHGLSGQRLRLAAILALSAALAVSVGATAQDVSPVPVVSPWPSASAPADPFASPGAARVVKRNAAGAIDPCALLTTAQIEAALGGPVTAMVAYGDIECRWTLGPLAAFPDRVEPWIGVQFWENDLPMLHVEAGNGGVTPVEGLGDRAYRTNLYPHLWVKHGTDVFVVGSSLMGLADDSEASRAVADAMEERFARLILDQL